MTNTTSSSIFSRNEVRSLYFLMFVLVVSGVALLALLLSVAWHPISSPNLDSKPLVRVDVSEGQPDSLVYALQAAGFRGDPADHGDFQYVPLNAEFPVPGGVWVVTDDGPVWRPAI